MASPSASHSSSQARPDFEESVTLLIESLKCFNSNNSNNNNLVEQIDKLRLQVEDSFLDSLNNDDNDIRILYRKSRLSHHFLETSNFVVHNNNNNSSINFSKILLEISGLGHANNIITKKQPIQNQNQQQRIVMNNTKVFFETLRSQSALLWNALEKVSAENINYNFALLRNELRCLAVDLMISSLPAPLIVNNNQMMMRDSFLLSTPNLLECCWMMLKTCEIMIDSSTSSSVCEKQNDHLITMMIYLSSIWKIATASSLFVASTSATTNNNNNNIISNLLSTKLSPVAKERLMSIAVDGLNLFVQVSLTKILFVNNHECDANLLAIIINHEQFRKNVLQTSIDFLGKSWPSLLPSFVKNCCDLIVETFLNTKIIPNVQQEDESKERINLIDFTISNLILKFVGSASSAPVASSTKMICQLLMIKSKYQHKCLKDIEAALETLNEVEIRIKQQQNNQNPRSSNNNKKTFNDDFVPLLCSVFGFRFKMFLEMLLSSVKSNSIISCGVSEDDAASTQQQQQQENDILCQKAFDTLLSLFEIVSTSSLSTFDVSFVPSLLAHIAKGTEALLSIENCQKILLFNENNHHQGLTLLLRTHEKLWNKNNDNNNSSSKRQLSKVRNMIIVNLCKILNSAESHFPFSAAVLLKVIQYLIKISTTQRKQNLNNNVENADSLLQVVDEEEVTSSFQDEINEQVENSSEEYTALWNCAQNLLLSLSSSSSSAENNNNDIQKQHEICLSLLRLCTFSAVVCGGVEQKSITLRALARAELLFATLSNSDENNSAAFDRAQHLLDEAKQISVHSNNNNNNSSTCSSPHTLLLQFQLHLFRFSISESEQHQQENDLVQDLDDIVSCLKHSPSPKLQADVKEALQIACHLAKQQYSTSKNNATAKHVCRHALKNFVDVQMLEMIKAVACNHNNININSHQQQQYVSTIFSILQAWNQTWNDEFSNNFPQSQDLPWLSEVIMKLAKTFSQSIFNITETITMMEFAKEFQFWIALMLKQLTSVNQPAIIQIDRIYLICVTVSDIMREILSKLSSSPSVKTEDAVKQDEANNTSHNSETTSFSQQQQQVRCENRVSTEIVHENDDDAAPSQQFQEKQMNADSSDNSDEIRNLRSSFLQLLLGAATEFLLLRNSNNSVEISISIHEALNLIQMVKKAISWSENNNNSIWLHLVSAEISYLIEKNNILSDENRENTEKEILLVLDEFYAKTSCRNNNNNDDDDESQGFLLDRISVDVQLAKMFSSEYFFEAAKKVIQDVFHVASPSSSSSPSLLFETISVICNAFHTGLTSCCPDKKSQLDFAEFASSFFIKLFSDDDNNLVEIMASLVSDMDSANNNNQDCAQATHCKNQENGRGNDQFFFFILQSLRAIVCELWNATVFDVNIQDIDRATKFVLCLRRIGVVLKKLQKVGKILVKNSSSSSSVINSKNQPNNYNNNGFVEVLLAQFQAATQTTLPIFQE